MPPRRALPVTTVRAHPALASCQVLLSNSPLMPESPLLMAGRPAIAARGSSFSSAQPVTASREARHMCFMSKRRVRQACCRRHDVHTSKQKTEGQRFNQPPSHEASCSKYDSY